jgi:hypothetical protein
MAGGVMSGVDDRHWALIMSLRETLAASDKSISMYRNQVYKVATERDEARAQVQVLMGHATDRARECGMPLDHDCDRCDKHGWSVNPKCCPRYSKSYDARQLLATLPESARAEAARVKAMEAALNECIEWLESRPDMTEGDAAVSSRAREALDEQEK